MAKKVKAIIKLQVTGGKATPAPPVGPALGQHGVNIMAFCKDRMMVPPLKQALLYQWRSQSMRTTHSFSSPRHHQRPSY